MRTLLIDNHDSYTYNLFQLMASVYRTEPTVLANDDPSWPRMDLDEFDALVISPGPGHPRRRRDLGACLDILRRTSLPVLGVCLGHQAIAWMCGAEVAVAPRPRHGHLTRVTHNGRQLFAGVPQEFTAVRYHSLCVRSQQLPAELEATAWAEDGVVMGLRHLSRPLWGVQFHPESVATDHGATLLDNFRRLAEKTAARNGSPFGRVPQATATPRPPRAPDCEQPGPWRVLHRVVDREADAEATFRELFSHSRHAFWLDSSQVEAGLSRFSFLGAPLGPDGEVLSYDVERSVLTVLPALGPARQVRESVFDVLDARLRERGTPTPALPFGLNCGYVGYFGYELKAELGFPNRHAAATPDAVWVSATRMVAVDHAEGRTYLLALARDGNVAQATAWLDETETRLALSGNGSGGPAAHTTADIDPEPWLRRPRPGYLADVTDCQHELHAGESYEICHTTTATMPFAGDPLERYLRQRRANPAPYAAYLRLGDAYVLCSSPERFLRVDKDHVVQSKPIKGTAPRHPDPAQDERLREELARSAKARAENLMIVDLLRNDLGRVCEVGTISVPRFMVVESYATVHQLVSTVEGRLRPGITAIDCVRACFPGGSMTGAPKQRTVEIIDRLENGPRGIYSGTLGWFGLDGTADLNIVIRTAVITGGELTVGAGGAIVLDSDPVDEYEEMLLKARAPLRGHTGGRAAPPSALLPSATNPA
ncbi:aminodeoxychorismate synthase, component I [Actinosynnema sp. ALI-1.44]|uniref:aminodeoxychorismate synthase component I n=1 Tax=Actinosynnema sp. ALI-1.44 TaxID=1933779 RepID=UPI00097C1007|nr:aminodeoxychorismate synthase component I [Actinosynnema sp. ALI-1.44]ONI86896.1 aminodeoxychorismate synthase, component I [Actinosynnema sp. ALI-1.44]